MKPTAERLIKAQRDGGAGEAIVPGVLTQKTIDDFVTAILEAPYQPPTVLAHVGSTLKNRMIEDGAAVEDNFEDLGNGAWLYKKLV